jgi:RNA polymerase sigma-70 factor (ECF subfamily)
VGISDTTTSTLKPEEQARAVEEAQRDPAAFSSLYQAYVRPIFRYLYSRLGSSEEAEDLTSQVFMEAIESLPRYRHQGHFPAWLFSIARHRLLNYWRRRSPDVAIEDAEGHPDPMDNPLLEIIRNEEIQNVIRLIEDLDEDDQDLLRLRFVGELNYGDIGNLLGLSEAATKKRIYRLLARMESQLEAHHG